MGNLRESADWKWLLGYSVVVLLGGIGLIAGAGIQTGPDTAVWRSPFFWIGWGLVAIGALLMVWKGWPTIRRYRPRWPWHVPPDLDGPDLEAKIQELQEKVTFHRASGLQAEIQKRARDTEVAELTAELEREQELHRQTKVHATNLEYKLRYDIEPRTFARLTEVELVVAHNEMKNVRKPLTAAGQGALDLAASLGRDMAGGDERNKVIGRFFGEFRFQPTSHLFDRLVEELDTKPRTDYRMWLIYYYEAYNELRRIIAKMAEFRGCSLGELDGYSIWRVHDETFLRKVGEIGVMHDIIKAVNERQKYPLPMPD